MKVLKMPNKKIVNDVEIDGNKITKADFDNLQDMQKHFSEAQRIYAFLSPGMQKYLHDFHNENTQVGHLVRWGEQNCEEVVAAVFKAAM